MLRERLNFLFRTVHPALYADVVRAFQEEGKLLCKSLVDVNSPQTSHPAGIWPLLTLLVAQHISPDIDPVYASSVAVSVECFVAALDLLDDIEDDDQTLIVQELGLARVLNVTTALLTLAQQVYFLIRTRYRTCTYPAPARYAPGICPWYYSGQHRDLLAEQRSV